ncbi:hypothetical protein JWS13_05500 [Rhodococcus pseudokoreensis]|uniref:Uncharacterized protein n=1 Tax=Rhodococcus pseudokoreensis TaxID=2811421 RepID=A0A974ZRX0_9NOCA|nr:hypothetical protein [Rhodococcus pseudokoreensis]QSE88120.1 hypothetical protein JWS13_05500 [Rhodococcus pseudokoreensis]
MLVAPHGRIAGYRIDPDLAYTDDYDAHLHAAAIHGGVEYVVPNGRGFLAFAQAHDDDLDYEVYTADDFLMLVHRSSPAAVQEVLLEQIDYRRRRSGPLNLAAELESAGAPAFAAVICALMHAPVVAAALTRPLDIRH